MKRIDPRAVGALALATTLAACVSSPPGPTIPVAPGQGKSFDAFAADQNVCQQYAASQVAPQVAAANNQAVGTALLTTALGAGLGAAVGGGGWHGNAGRGAGIGAASGAAFGTVVGAAGSSYEQMSVQQRYDVMYGECMMAHGNQVPGFAPPPGAPRYSAGIRAAIRLWSTIRLRAAPRLWASAGLPAAILSAALSCNRRPVSARSVRAGFTIVGQKDLSQPAAPRQGPAPDNRLLVGLEVPDHRLHLRSAAELVPLLDQARAHAGWRCVEHHRQFHRRRLSRCSFPSRATPDQDTSLPDR